MAAAIAFRSLGDTGSSLVNGLRYETAYERQFKNALRELRLVRQERERQSCGEVVNLPIYEASSTWDAEAFIEPDSGFLEEDRDTTRCPRSKPFWTH
jgi:hypothetical protein